MCDSSWKAIERCQNVGWNRGVGVPVEYREGGDERVVRGWGWGDVVVIVGK